MPPIPPLQRKNTMRGQVLDYTFHKNEGLISATDGSRYTFSGSEWKDDTPPARGISVDFEVQANSAIGIYRVQAKWPVASTGIKSKAAVTLWGTFLGPFGAHKFYMGSWGWGIIYLLTWWLYIPFIISMVEWVRIVLMSDEEFNAKAAEFQRRDAGPFGFFW